MSAFTSLHHTSCAPRTPGCHHEKRHYFSEHNPTQQQQRLAYSFNALSSTSFDAQNTVSVLLPSPKAHQGAHAKQLPLATRMCSAERKPKNETDSNDLWPDLPICSGLPCAHPTCPNRLELPPGRMGWSWNRQNHPEPERPLWPRESISPRRQHRAPAGGLPPSPEQRDKVAPLGKGVKPPCHAGNCRGLESPGGLSRWPLKPPSLVHQSRVFWLLTNTNIGNHWESQ
jgi:hypothetical protein